MGYQDLQSCVRDLEGCGQLRRITTAIDPHLELAAIQRRVYQAQGPALLFTQVQGTRFPVVANLFGTRDRMRWIFRDTLHALQKLVALKVNPQEVFRKPLQTLRLPRTLLHLWPKTVRRGPILHAKISLSELPQIQSWPDDGGPFITLPQVYTEDVSAPGFKASNLGMYRIQLAGNQYQKDREVGLHYQLHRGIGVHQQKALAEGQPFHVAIFVGGAPAMSLAAVMPLPEGMSELSFAGALGGHRIAMVRGQAPLPLAAQADFCIVGRVDPARRLPEGPFGDHLGYYSLTHDFPVLSVDAVYHREGAIWPFTTVGRPPQEDTEFGHFIHELTHDLIPTVLTGVKEVHAVDAAGVHPLLLAIGSERYTPYQNITRPQEILTQANAILGQGQLSLAKYLWIANQSDNPELKTQPIDRFLTHMLERVDWSRDLHFQTQTTMDTLDYSGTALNAGSKVMIAAAGMKLRQLQSATQFQNWPEGFKDPRMILPGILLLQAPACTSIEYRRSQDPHVFRLLKVLDDAFDEPGIALIVLVDDSEFAVKTLNNFLWVSFTRSDPASDIYGVRAFYEQKHWGCRGPLVIDARLKPHHAPPLIDDPDIEKRIDALGAPGGPLHGII